jgi:hypothetical protein
MLPRSSSQLAQRDEYNSDFFMGIASSVPIRLPVASSCAKYSFWYHFSPKVIAESRLT